MSAIISAPVSKRTFSEVNLYSRKGSPIDLDVAPGDIAGTLGGQKGNDLPIDLQSNRLHILPYLHPSPQRTDSDCLRTCSRAMSEFPARPFPKKPSVLPGSGTERLDQSPRSLTRKATRHQQAKPLRGGNRMPVRPGTRQLLQYPLADRSGRPGLFLG